MTPLELFHRCTKRSGASEEALQAAERALGVTLPADYRALLLESDGLEGFPSDDVYLALWRVSELAELNDGYGVREFAPGLTLIGSDGGGEGFGFRGTEHGVTYVMVPFISMEAEHEIELGSSLVEFLDHLERLARED